MEGRELTEGYCACVFAAIRKVERQEKVNMVVINNKQPPRNTMRINLPTTHISTVLAAAMATIAESREDTSPNSAIASAPKKVTFSRATPNECIRLAQACTIENENENLRTGLVYQIG